jgi:DNA-binding MarR family transcriptional regulator
MAERLKIQRKNMGIFNELDNLLLSQLRLAIMSLLLSTDEAEFNSLKEQTGATSGNLSVQIDKLKKAGYIEVEKTFRNNYPLTLCRITAQGRRAFQQYIEDLKQYFDPKAVTRSSKVQQ